MTRHPERGGGCTSRLREPDVVAEEVRHTVIQPVHHPQCGLYIEEGVIVAVKNPAVAVAANRDVGQERSKGCPVLPSAPLCQNIPLQTLILQIRALNRSASVYMANSK